MFKYQPRQDLVKIAALAPLRPSGPGLNVRHQPFQSLGAYYRLQILEQLSFFCENKVVKPYPVHTLVPERRDYRGHRVDAAKGAFCFYLSSLK